MGVYGVRPISPSEYVAEADPDTEGCADVAVVRLGCQTCAHVICRKIVDPVPHLATHEIREIGALAEVPVTSRFDNLFTQNYKAEQPDCIGQDDCPNAENLHVAEQLLRERDM